MKPTPADAATAFLRARRELATAFAPQAPMRRHALPLPGGELQHWQAGDGPTVLLVHGWEGSPADMTAFVEPLIAAGHRVVLAELPGHGHSSFEWTSVPHSAEAIFHLGTSLGPLKGVIAHSVGGAVVTRAMEIGLAAERAVLIASPARYRDYARGFAAMLGLDREGSEQMLQHLAQRWGVDVARLSTPASAARLSQPALVIHSADDAVVPIGDAESIVAAWLGAALMRCDGLGHRRLLADPGVVAAAVGFVSAPALAALA